MPEALKAMWEIRAGLIPGEPIAGYTRRFFYTSADHTKDGGNQEGRNQPASLYLLRSVEAHDYAQQLEMGGLNWVTNDYVWI